MDCRKQEVTKAEWETIRERMSRPTAESKMQVKDLYIRIASYVRPV